MFVRQGRAHERDHVWEARLVDHETVEEALDDDQAAVRVLRRPVQIEEHLGLLEATGQAILALVVGERVVDGPSCVRDELSAGVVDRDRDPAPHQTAGAIAEAEGPDRRHGQTALHEIGVVRVEVLERPLQRRIRG